jgi:hypothetical protein
MKERAKLITALMACCLFVLWKRDYHSFFFKEKEKQMLHTHRNPITQREGNALRLATDADVASDSACFRSLHAEVGQCILA